MKKHISRFIPSILACLTTFPLFAIKPDRTYIRLPQHLGLIYKRLDVRTDDGYRIETWFFPAQTRADENVAGETMRPYETDGQRHPTIVICNGDAGNMSYYQLVLAACFTARGYNVATFDYRGFGASDPFPMESDYLCYTEMLTDYRAAIDCVAGQSETVPGQIYLLGWSTGAYLSMIVARDNPAVKGCILRGVPTSFEQTIPLLRTATGKTDAQLLIPQDFPAEDMPIFAAPSFDKDILLVVGSRDERTPPRMAESIFERLPEGIVKDLWVAPEAEHGGMKAPEFLYREEFVCRTADFLARSLGGDR